MSALRALVRDGFLDLGSMTLGSEVTLGDPGISGQAEAHRRQMVAPGAWRCLLRVDDDSDQVAELVLVRESELGQFYDLYDAAEVPAPLPVVHGRVLVAPPARFHEVELRRSALEIDDFPWVFDDGVVTEAREPAWVFVAGEPATSLITIAFGPRSDMPVGRIPLEN
jgi:hypothetical protein